MKRQESRIMGDLQWNKHTPCFSWFSSHFYLDENLYTIFFFVHNFVCWNINYAFSFHFAHLFFLFYRARECCCQRVYFSFQTQLFSVSAWNALGATFITATELAFNLFSRKFSVWLTADQLCCNEISKIRLKLRANYRKWCDSRQKRMERKK